MEGLSIVGYAEKRPPSLTALLGPSLAERHCLVRRTVEEWTDGTNRFDRPGEVFYLASIERATIGMCGLNADPFLDDPGVGRIRHLYVLAEYRRNHVGRGLVDACLRHAAGRFDRVRLRTLDPVAARFYEAMGFTRVDEAEATHSVTL